MRSSAAEQKARMRHSSRLVQIEQVAPLFEQHGSVGKYRATQRLDPGGGMQRVDPHVGLGLANFGAGLSGTSVVNGSPTKTQRIDGAGGRSQLSLLFTIDIVLLVLLFLTGPLAFMPEAVLSAGCS